MTKNSGGPSYKKLCGPLAPSIEMPCKRPSRIRALPITGKYSLTVKKLAGLEIAGAARVKASDIETDRWR